MKWDEVLFWENTARGDTDECWLYGKGDPKYYGSSNGQGAHVFSYELHHGPVPAGLQVNHTCDTPRCVNPGHLYAGTPKQNTADMMERGRWRGGSNKLTPEQIREVFLSSEPDRAAARRLGVRKATIVSIRNGQTWVSVTAGLVKRRKGSRSGWHTHW